MTTAYGATSTTEDVLQGIELGGRRVLVTGVSAGIGVETARALVAHGALVVGAARDLEKARAATAAIPAQGQGSLEIVHLDLADLASVRACADRLLAASLPFDAIIANAAVMATPFGRTKDGFETQFGVNHLGHFVLVNRLATLLKPGARVVMVSSAGHRSSDVNLDDPNFDRTEYTPFGAYGRSKTANVLFAVEFDRRHREDGIRAIALHPGVIPTELVRHLDAETRDQAAKAAEASRRGDPAAPFFYKTIPQGAATSVWAAFVAPAEAVGGRFAEDCAVAEPAEDDSNGRKGVRPYAIDPERARALWALSETMVGERFPQA
jgi:NAD(P)-dependent dehydrogenase (short-subunit alcohol dehydrogenase family)